MLVKKERDLRSLLWRYLGILLLVSLASLGGTVLYAFNEVINTDLEKRVNQLHSNVMERFRTFDGIIADEEKPLDVKMTAALSTIHRILDELPGGPASASPELLQKLARAHGVDELYVIDRKTVVVATSFAADLDFELGTISESMRSFLVNLFNSGKFVVDRINVSVKTGIWNKYAYYAPKEGDYIIDASIEVRKYLTRSKSSAFEKFLFDDFFSDITNGQPLISEVRIFLLNELNVYPFFGSTPDLTKIELRDLREANQVRRKSEGIIETFSRIETTGSRMAGAEALIIGTKIDLSPINTLNTRVFLLVLILTAISLIVAYTVLTTLLERNIIRRINLIDDGLKRVTEGDYETETVVDGIEELIEIAKHVNSMRVRIGKRESQLEDARATLERRVNERTAELREEIEIRKKTETKLALLATTDTLTGLPNRRLFTKRAKIEQVRAQRNGNATSLLFLDLDHFKRVNDTFGHDMGDQVLIEIGQILMRIGRASDTPARLGGEEFAFLLPETALKNGLIFAEHLRKEIAETEFSHGNESLSITISIGLVEWDVQTQSLDQVLKLSDDLLYKAKAKGRNCVCS